MASRTAQLEKDRRKALAELLVAECRADEPNLESMETMVRSGADVRFSHAKALYWAAKKLNFDAVAFLVRSGVLEEPIAAGYIAQMCDAKGFCEEKEPAFFAVLDLCRDKVENYTDLFVPYVNGMAVTGRMDKLRALTDRYYLTESEVAGCVYVRIIFEIILGAQDEVLDFINRHVKWMDAAAYDLAVSSGDWLVLEYIVGHSGYRVPGETAVAQAVYSGFFPVLDILMHNGYDFCRNPVFLKKACRAAIGDGCAAVRYLFGHGYAPTDRYDGRSVRENALKDNNAPLLAFLDRAQSVETF